MRVLAVVGFSGSGKTRLVVRLIKALKDRGLRVAAVKRCSHGFSLDTEGKDTEDFSRAGAESVAMVSPEGWAAFGRAGNAEATGLAVRLFPGADIVLIEGGKDIPGLAKIEVRRAGVAEVTEIAPRELVAIVADGPVPGAAVPVFGPDEIGGLVDLIMAQKEGEMTKIQLTVDGREIILNAFVQSFIERTVVGMVTALTGVDPEPRQIRLEIDRTGTAGRGEAKP